MHGNSDFGKECLLDTDRPITGCKIDMNLKATQVMLSSLNALDTADDDYLEGKISQAKWFAGIGTAGPAVVAGTMLIMYRIMMALFIGFAPIFILSLMFKKTAPLFQKWLQYGLATIFSTVLLGVMTNISMDLIGNLWGSSAVGGFVAKVITGTGTEGIMQTVTQQLGVGLILSTLLITVPPMAGAWFNGLMASFSPYSVIREWNNSGGGGSGLPPHMGGSSTQQQMTERKIQHQYEQVVNNQNNSPSGNMPNHFGITNGRVGSVSQPIESIKQNSLVGNAVTPTVNTATQIGQQSIGASKPKPQKEEEKS